jgi:N-carbamoylputrescine amidase
MKGYMYILCCSDGSYYTGSTSDLESRIEQHQLGLGANFTRKHLPVKLVYFEEFDRIDDAFYREKQIQGWSRKKKEALINGRKDLLPGLSKSKISTIGSTSSPTDTFRKTNTSTSSVTDKLLPEQIAEPVEASERNIFLTKKPAAKPVEASEGNISSTKKPDTELVEAVEVVEVEKTANTGKKYSLFLDSGFNATKTMKTAIIQQANSSNIEENKAKLARNIAQCASQGAELVVLQELHNSLYFCQVEDVDNFDFAETIPGPSTAFYGELAKKHSIVLVTSLFEKRAAGLYHNTAVVFEKDGSIAGIYRKNHIPDDPGFYEKFYFTPGDLGFNPIQTSVGKLGVLVCWDQWYPEAARLMALAGAEILIYPTAIGWDMRDTNEERERQRNAWITVQRGHAVANGLPVIAVNRVGIEEDPSGQSAGINFWGNSFVAGPQGEFLYEAPTNEEVNQIIDIDLKRSEDVRRIWPFLRDRRIDAYKELTKRFRD